MLILLITLNIEVESLNLKYYLTLTIATEGIWLVKVTFGLWMIYRWPAPRSILVVTVVVPSSHLPQAKIDDKNYFKKRDLAVLVIYKTTSEATNL